MNQPNSFIQVNSSNQNQQQQQINKQKLDQKKDFKVTTKKQPHQQANQKEEKKSYQTYQSPQRVIQNRKQQSQHEENIHKSQKCIQYKLELEQFSNNSKTSNKEPVYFQYLKKLTTLSCVDIYWIVHTDTAAETQETHNADSNSRIIKFNKKSNFKEGKPKEDTIYHALIISLDEILYISDFQKGKLYKVKYDEANNPSYSIKKGTFFIESDKIQMHNENLIEYIGKSNNVFKANQQVSQQQISSDPGGKKRIKIMDENGKVLNVNPPRNYQIMETWIKFNQQISQKDINILSPYSQAWVTSSIIDAYVFYLNMKNSKYYFKLRPEERSKKERLLIVSSSVFTSFFQAQTNYNVESQHLEIFQKEFLEFQEINYQVWHVYQQIAFVINQSNVHWFLILIKFKSKKMKIYDSLRRKYTSLTSSPYLSYFNNFFAKFGFEDKLKLFWSKKNSQQSDGYSCGYHTCQFMKYLSEKHNGEKKKYEFNEKLIKKELTQLISKNK